MCDSSSLSGNSRFYIWPKVRKTLLSLPLPALLYSILFAFWSRCKLPCMAGCVCVCVCERLPCVRLCECVTCSWFELCRLHAHSGSVLQGNVGVVSARPLTLVLSTCITHTRTCPPQTRTHTQQGRERERSTNAQFQQRRPRTDMDAPKVSQTLPSQAGTRIPRGRGFH